MPLDQIDREISVLELRADVAILATIFGDKDHANPRGNPNVAYNDDGKSVYYDFGGAHLESDWNYQEVTNTILTSLNQEMLEIYTDKLRLLSDRLSGEDGIRFLEAIANHGRLRQDTKSLQVILSTRIIYAEQVARNLEASFMHSSDT